MKKEDIYKVEGVNFPNCSNQNLKGLIQRILSREDFGHKNNWAFPMKVYLAIWNRVGQYENRVRAKIKNDAAIKREVQKKLPGVSTMIRILSSRKR